MLCSCVILCRAFGYRRWSLRISRRSGCCTDSRACPALYHTSSFALCTDRAMTSHILECLDALARDHPHAGVVLLGDLHQLRRGELMYLMDKSSSRPRVDPPYSTRSTRASRLGPVVLVVGHYAQSYCSLGSDTRHSQEVKGGEGCCVLAPD